MIDYIACILVRILNIIFKVIPISASLWFGRRLGTVTFFFNKKRRLIAYANLKAAFSEEKNPSELRDITKKVYQHLVQTFVEILSLTRADRKYIDRYVEIANFERIVDASKSGRGTILLTAHFGDWELSSLTSALKGFPILVLAREQKMKRLNELLNRLRESKGCKVVRKGMSTKNVLRTLQDKNIVGILSDQDAGKNGIFVDFFGRPTSTHAGPAEIAKRTDSIILPNFIVRKRGPYHTIYLEEYIDFRDIKGEDDVIQGLQKFVNLLESYVRRYPEQWLWLHKRWKSTPERTALVLNDGKAGHLNQSLAIARQVQEARVTQGYKLDDTKVVIIDVKFRSKILKLLLGVCASFASWRCHGCMRCMRLCLERESYEKLVGQYSEFVVSCGSAIAPVNIFMKIENNAKNIVIMRPGSVLGLAKFDLAVIPRHDRPPHKKNVIETMLAPHVMDVGQLSRQGDLLKRRINLDKPNVVSLLVGGDNHEFLLTEEIMDKALDGILKFCMEFDAALLTTTSRRTPKSIDVLLKRKLSDNPISKSLVIANEENPEGTVGGMLALGGIAIVSGESISMISESIGAGKKTIAFELAKKREAPTKHERLLKGLSDSEYLRVTAAGNIYDALVAAHSDRSAPKQIDDKERTFAAVRRLI